MLAFAVELWKTIVADHEQPPCVILPQALGESLAEHFEPAPHLLPNGAVSALKQLQTIVVDEQPQQLLLIPPLIGYTDLPKSLQKGQDEQTNFHDLALQTLLEQMPAGARVTVLLPTSFLFVSGPADLRARLVSEHRVRLVLEFDFEAEMLGLEGYDEARRLATLVFQVGDGGDNRARLFACPHIPQLVEATGERTPHVEREKAVQRDLERLLDSQGKPTGFGLVLQQQPGVDQPWQSYWHQRNYQKSLRELETYGSLKPLGDLFTILRGFHISEQVNYLVNTTNSNKGIPVIEESNILADNCLNHTETRYRALRKETAAYHLQPNDICLCESVDADLRLRLAHVQPEQLPLAALASVIILRPKADVTVDSELVTAYLRSGRVAEVLRSQGVGSRLYRDSLSNVPVPTDDDELKGGLTDIRTAAAALDGWRSDADKAIEQLFAAKPAQEARGEFLTAGRTLRQRERAARQIDDLSYRLRVGLPHPLAYRWRLAETSVPDYEGYKNLPETAEVVICFLANLTIVAARVIDCPLQCISDLATKLSDPDKKQGTSFGDWLNVLRQFNESKTAKEAGTFPLFEIARLLDESETNEAIQRLSVSRNDEAHGRGPKGPQVQPQIEQSMIDLTKFISAVEFLVEYPLRYVIDAQVDSLTGITTYTYHDLMGDHPLVAPQTAETQTPNLEKGSLYVVDRSQQLHLLRPLLSRYQLPDGRWGTFFLDKFDNKAECCELKCLEFPETVEDEGQVRAFRAVGLLL